MSATALPARTEIAIVGAGPTGLALAVTLASAGVDFVIVDRLPEGANTSRAAVVHARTLEVLDELDASKELIDRGIQVTRFAVRDGSRRLLTVSFDRLPTPHPYTLMVPQYETEDVLLARLRILGGDVHRPYEVGSVIQDQDGVTLTMSTGETLRAGFVVGADGMHSAVREASGIGFTGSAYGESFVLADVEMDWAPGRREVSLTFGAAGLAVVAPLPGGHYRVVATVDDAPITPAGGQGMNTGIQDGYALGRAFSTGQLDGYEAQRRPVAQRVVAFTDRMTKMGTTRSPAVRGARNAVLPLLGRIPAFRTKLATELAELNYR